MNRRQFIQTGLTGLAGLSVISTGIINLNCSTPVALKIDNVKLGKSGLTVSRIAMGTGTHGGNKSSDFTRMGMEQFTKLALHAYERGITFFDTADSYGSHQFVGNVLKSLPREKITLLSKMWTSEDPNRREPFEKAIDRFRLETGSDYFDILLMHCLQSGNWSETRKYYIDEFSKAKQDGIVKAVGVSCHNFDALAEAVEHPWVDVIMVRINPFGTNMDSTPDKVKEVLEKAKNNNIGLIGMKIFGEGKNVKDEERQQSLEYAIKEVNTHCMTLGMTSELQVDDAVERVLKIVKV